MCIAVVRKMRSPQNDGRGMPFARRAVFQRMFLPSPQTTGGRACGATRWPAGPATAAEVLRLRRAAILGCRPHSTNVRARLPATLHQNALSASTFQLGQAPVRVLQ